MSCRIDLVAGTRPNVVKIAPLFKALKSQDWCAPRILYIRQHVEPNMSADIFGQLGVDPADVLELPLTATGFGARLGEIIEVYAAELRRDRPDIVVVPGDVDVSLGAALATRRAGIPLAHLEAGLRSYDATMPEEANRVLIDSISDLLLAPSEASASNLIYREGRSHDEVHFVGNIMIDSLLQSLDPEKAKSALDQFGLEPGNFGILTLHRPANVDDTATLETILTFIETLTRSQPILFPIHPRTRETLQTRTQAWPDGLITCDPIDYVSFVNLMSQARFFITDSGGVQEETSYLGVPCFTLRPNTERPITVHEGTNRLIDLQTAAPIIHAVLAAPAAPTPRMPLWDGLAAWRVSQVIHRWWDATAGRAKKPA